MLSFAAWVLLAWLWPQLWLFVLPATLPAADFAPWTGWLMFDEFDLLVLGATVTGLSRMAASADAASLRWSRRTVAMACAAGLLSLIGLWRGLADAGGVSPGWFDGHADAGNVLRVSKSLAFVLLVLPMLNDAMARSADRAMRLLLSGMLCGLMIVGVAALWERAAYPGWLDTSQSYRTTALFWEMHVGGAAIDAYLALTAPIVAWGLWSSRRVWQWLVCAALALLAGYACLTTFSRGVYLALATQLLLLGWLLAGREQRAQGRSVWHLVAIALMLVVGATVALMAVFEQFGYAGVLVLLGLQALLLSAWKLTHARHVGWRRVAGSMLALALMSEAVAVLAPDTFMSSRVADSRKDYQSRVAHWQRGLGLLHGPTEWLLGLGAGRLPSHYAAFTEEGRWPGSAQWMVGPGDNASARIRGPRRARPYALFGLSQRVPAGNDYRLILDLSTTQGADLYARVCEAHLIYELACRSAFIRLPPERSDVVRHLELPLNGQLLGTRSGLLQREAMFTLSVLDEGGVVDVHRVQLKTKTNKGVELLRNGDFRDGLARWMPRAQHFFLPWHIDNLTLELLIERGLSGLCAFAAVTGGALWRLLRGSARDRAAAPFLAASMAGVLCVGLVSSVMDVPRVAFGFGLVMLTGLQLSPRGRRTPPRTAAPSPAS